MPTMPIRPSQLDSMLSAELASFRRIADDATGPDLDVRLVVDIGDESWWLATGDVQYDTVHGDICAAATLCVSMTPEEMREVRSELINDVESQRADFNGEPDDSCQAEEETGVVCAYHREDCPIPGCRRDHRDPPRSEREPFLVGSTAGQDD